MDFSNLIQGFLFKLSHGLVKIDEWISLICSMDLSKLQHGFVTVVTVFVKVVLCISRPLPHKTKLKFDQEFEVSAQIQRGLT